MEDLKLGDVVRHKATHKRCVVTELKNDGRVVVTDQDGEGQLYYKHELEPMPEDRGPVSVM